MAPSNVAHTHPFSLALCPARCVRLSTTCFAASATNTQHAPFAQQPPHNNQPLVLQPHHLLPQHTQHHNTTNHPPVGHCVALPTTKSCHSLPHCCASTTHLSGHLLLSTHTTRSVSWLHHTQHNPAPQACASVGACGALWLVSTHILFVLASPHHKHRVLAHQCATPTPTAPQHTQLGVVHHAMQPHHTHGCGGCVWCSGGCVGWLAQPPSLLVMPSMWCAAPVSSHHNLVPSSTHTVPSTQQPLHRLVPPWQQPPAHKPCQSTTLMACGVWCCVCCT